MFGAISGSKTSRNVCFCQSDNALESVDCFKGLTPKIYGTEPALNHGNYYDNSPISIIWYQLSISIRGGNPIEGEVIGLFPC